MFLKILPSPTKNALQKLDASRFPQQTGAYLAGGTGLSLHLGHRYSYDLDFFTQKELKTTTLVQFIGKCGKFKLESNNLQTIIGTFENIKFSLFYYQYPLLAPQTKIFANTNVASKKDIAAMKISAITQRGAKRDFVDLYFLTKSFSLKEILNFYHTKFQNLSTNRIHVLKSLIYFADAEKEPMPQLIKQVRWEDVKNTILEEVQKLTKKEIG